MGGKFTKRFFCCFCAWLLMIPSGSPTALAKGNGGARRSEEMKAAVRQLGQGNDARILLRLRDGERLGGYVRNIQEDDFSVRIFCNGAEIPVPFVQVKGLRGLNVATGAKVSVGKGVSAKLGARLAAVNPCPATYVRTGGSDWNTDFLVGLIAGGAVLAFVLYAAVELGRD